MALLTTVDAVLDLTKATVSEADITAAQALVGLFTGYDLDADDVFTEQAPFARDQRRLAQAIGYQAAFISVHPDVFTASDITSSTADGYSQAYRELGNVIAPLAKIALRKLSKNRSRSVRVHAGREVILARRLEGGFVPEFTDELHAWEPM